MTAQNSHEGPLSGQSPPLCTTAISALLLQPQPQMTGQVRALRNQSAVPFEQVSLCKVATDRVESLYNKREEGRFIEVC